MNSIHCGGVEDVVSVLSLVRRGMAQVEEEEGKENGQEEEEEVESGEVESKRDNHVDDHGWK